VSRIDDIITGILRVEGAAYTDRAADAGGPTKYGITQRTLAAWRGHAVTPADVAALLEGEARRIYFDRYVQKPGFGHVLSISEQLGEELIDSGVNCGPGRAIEWLQRFLNVANRRGRDYPDIKVDGDLGPATMGALKAYLRTRGAKGVTVLLRGLNALQACHYITLAERRAFDEENLFGWMLQRVGAVA